MKIRYKIQTQLIVSYILLAIIIVTFIGSLLNISIKQGFENYVIGKHDEKVETLIHNLEYSYDISEGINLNDVTHLGVEAIEHGLIIELHDTKNMLLWSANEHNSGLCETMINNVKDNMFDHYSGWDGEYIEETYELHSSSEIYANLTIGYLGPYYFNEEELFFLSRINKVIIGVAILALILSIIIGILNATSITTPIKKIIYFQNLMLNKKNDIIPQYDKGAQELYSLFESTQLLESRIRDQESLRKQLTLDMAHELKTPLTSLQGTLEAMIDGIFPLTVERISSCHEEIIRIKNLIVEVEHLSNIENKNLRLCYNKVDVSELIQSVFKSFESQILTNNFKYQIIQKQTPNTKYLSDYPCDESKMKQVFINLIDNSIKYAGSGTNIRVELEILTENQLHIKYSDDGNGIKNIEADYIFERFYRGDPSRTGNNGLGIGLTLVKSIIEKHMGSIKISSDIKRGLSFDINMPYKKL